MSDRDLIAIGLTAGNDGIFLAPIGNFYPTDGGRRTRA
jgi:hypothetical protein